MVLKDLPQYHLDRNTFCQVVEDTIGYYILNDAFTYDTCVHGDEFTWFRVDDELYILHRNSGMMVNWYKNAGRTNTCSQNYRTVDDYYEFFTKFKEDFVRWERQH